MLVIINESAIENSSLLMKNNLLYLYQFIKNILDDLFSNKLDEAKLIKNFLPNKIIYFDVGYNVGHESKKISKKFNNNCKIHAFEPNPELNRNIPKFIKFNNFAVSLKSNSKVKFVKKKISSHSFLEKNKTKEYSNHEIIYVRTKSLSEYCKKNKIEKINFLKIDTEGNELDCLKSLKNYIKKVTLMKIEITQKNFFEVHEYLNKHSFSLIGIINIKYKKNLFEYGNAFFVNKRKKI